ncbi:MAG: lipopolysaccharide kinase InaA family protein, partial [Planctomycetota bacterium]|nr:lipopolysaccharide kinase InaA family protein [Planctomycetota bacterium]
MHQIGPYLGEIADAWREHADALAALAASAAAPGARSAVARMSHDGVDLAVKRFRGPGWLGSRWARRTGSKAARSWRVARALQDAGIGTPEPVACFERWEGPTLLGSVFITRWEEHTDSLSTHLLSIYHKEPRYRRTLNLIDVVAKQLRRMHDAGVRHGDCGNQNILVRRTDVETFQDVRFIDLNRGRVRGAPLSMRDRAFDVSRLRLPSRLRWLLCAMMYPDEYHRGEPPPRALLRWISWHGTRFAIHNWSRKIRRPLRTRRRAREKRGDKEYPRLRDIWMWDDHSEQAIGLWMRREKNRLRSYGSTAKIAGVTAVSLVAVRRRWRRVRSTLYRRPVDLRDRIGMTITLEPETIERKRAVLATFRHRVPLLLRFYHHEGKEQWAFGIEQARKLHADGHPISLALLQDRRAVLDPQRWRAFLFEVLEGLGDIAVHVEVGHAINRVKWGLWGLHEHRALMKPLADLKARWPSVKWIGPAVNDFEFHFILASLPRDVVLDALSLHLYMDRSGAPEGTQKILGTKVTGIDKFVYARAVAELTRRCGDDVIVSEVNWPLGIEGGCSHEFAPYVWSGDPHLDTTAGLR